MVTIAYVVPPLASLALLAVEFARGNLAFAAQLGLLLLISLPVLVYCYRRDFRPYDE